MAMPRLDITDAAVRSALAAGGPPRTYLDNALPGFMLVVNAQSASFVYQRKVTQVENPGVDGRPRKLPRR